MILVFYKTIAAIIIFILSIATVIYTLKKKRLTQHHESAELGEALASGIFLGAAFFHMLPESVTMFEKLYGPLTYPVPEVICVGGFLLLLFLERFSLANFALKANTIPFVLAVTLIIHALIEGAALGIGSTFSESFMIFIAILAHKGSECFALCMIMLRHHWLPKQILFTVLFFSLMTPLGIAIGGAIHLFTFARNGELAAAIFNAFAAGTFLYISTLHHVHFHQHAKETQGMLEFVALVLGVVAMGTIAVWA